ncbi:hypothetical protein [Thiocapsa sp. UBA6158]|jgi:hypothetical protein|uniref:hypothetical protein n=1 Tax=Thiocapsa sp. UBA6158 TaxID=1947692 RepID=UPI0025E5B494|nr:hypothetical protein [Thiocapsa sp. UBA6158]
MPLSQHAAGSRWAGFRLLIPCLLVAMLCGPHGTVHAEVSTPPPVDACALLTQADVEAVYGSVVGAPNPKSTGRAPVWVSMCNFDNAHTDAPMLSVGLLVKPHGAADPAHAYAGYVDELRRALGEVAVPVSVEGLPGPAGWDGDTGQLTLFVGPYQVILTSLGRFAGDRLSLATQLAELVVGRLSLP